ncbi:MAG: DNA primase [Gemmatimonadales bacterium]|nr:DNA primase [Gemmatimonadales bacterium]
MSRIPDELVEQVRDAADLVGLIGETVPLKRTGADWRGPCPFHGGTHNNFAVIPRKQRFYCFVCHESGDAFSWLMKRLGLDYPSAIREVARRAGIVIPEQAERAGPDPREPLLQAAAAAHDWFQRQLRERPDAAPARTYVADRGFDAEQVALLELGWAPPGDAFLAAMGELGIAPQVLAEAGLLRHREDGGTVPVFRRRLILPIHDARGRVVAFGGRALDDRPPKYLNSPETPIFRKGQQLYHLHLAKGAIRREQDAILVEGYFDVIRLALAGVEHVVAGLGTAFTEEQAQLLRRLTPRVTLLYDSDSAGLKATFRAGHQLLRAGLQVRVATMPPGDDPDTLVRAGGAEALAPILRDALDLLERQVQILQRAGWLADVARRRAALDKLLDTLRATSDPVTRDLYVARVAEATGVQVETVRGELAARPARGGTVVAGQPGPRSGAAVEPSPDVSRQEAQLLAVIVNDDAWLDRAGREVDPALLPSPAAAELLGAMLVAGSRDLPEGVSYAAATLWSRARERAIAGDAAASTYAGALAQLRISRELPSLDAVADPVARRKAEAAIAEKHGDPYHMQRRGFKRRPPAPDDPR